MTKAVGITSFGVEKDHLSVRQFIPMLAGMGDISCALGGVAYTDMGWLAGGCAFTLGGIHT